MMFYGINPITEANYVTFFERHVKLAIAAGDKPTLTITDCRNAIGLGSNASTLTDAAFTKKVLARLEATVRGRLDNERYREKRLADEAAAEREEAEK